MLPDFDFIVAHPSILPEMVAIKGLLKKKFPNPGAGKLIVLQINFLHYSNL